MKAYVVAAETVTDEAVFAEYRKAVQPRSKRSAAGSSCAATI